MVCEPADVVGGPKEPVDALSSDAIARAPLLLDEAVVDQFADVFADSLTRDADFLGDFTLADRGWRSAIWTRIRNRVAARLLSRTSTIRVCFSSRAKKSA